MVENDPSIRRGAVLVFAGVLDRGTGLGSGADVGSDTNPRRISVLTVR
jgi:hypothetical protein